MVNQLSRSLTALDHVVDVVTLDPPNAAWLSGLPGSPRALGPGRAKYGYTPRLRRWLRDNVATYDAVVVHGIWQFQSAAVRSMCLRAGVPYFLYVHGALDPWFEERFPLKHAKKSLYWRLVEHRCFRDARAVLFTCEEERVLAQKSFSPYRAAEAIAPIGVEDPSGDPSAQRRAFLDKYPDLETKRIVLFLGRLHPKKGCDLLLQAFADVAHRDDSLHLVIVGPDEAGTEDDLRQLSDSLGLQPRVTWVGMLDGDAKWGAYRSAEVFALPSHSENFGIVIAEALACGVPVLISDKVNIWREVADAGAGLVAPDTPEGAADLLNRWLVLSAQERDGFRLRARAGFLKEFEATKAGTRFQHLISESIQETTR